MLEQVFGDWRLLAVAGKGIPDEEKRHHDWAVAIQTMVARDLDHLETLFRTGLKMVSRLEA